VVAIESVGYGILIAGLMGASAFGGFILCRKVRKSDIRYLPPLGTADEVGEIQQRRFTEAFNLEDPPQTAAGFMQRFKRQSASEELKSATRLEDATGV